MALSQSPSVSVSLKGQPFAGSDAARTVVWIRGDHDAASAAGLSEAMSRAMELDEADFIVDLSEVGFMDASTVDAIIKARNLLGARSRSLVLRSPSTRARRVFDACHLSHLIEADGAPALASWVAVPTTGRDGPADPEHTEAHDREMVGAATPESVPDELHHERR